MAKSAIELPVPQSVSAGAAVVTRELDAPAQLHLSGTFSATVRLQVSADGTEWFDATGDLTAPGVTAIQPMPAIYMRVNTTVYASGAPVAKLVAHERQGG